jgi:hypothetical protein
MNIISKIYDKVKSYGIYTSGNHIKNEPSKTNDNLVSTIDSKTIELIQNKDGSFYNLFKTNINQITNEIINEIITEAPNKEPTQNYLTKEAILSLEILSLGIDYLNAFLIPSSIASIILSPPISFGIGLIFLSLRYLYSVLKYPSNSDNANNNDNNKLTNKIVNKIDKIKEKIKDLIKWDKINYIFDKIGKIKSYIPLYPALKVPNYLKQEFINTLDKLPLKAINKASFIEINDKINDQYEALGVTINKITNVPIYIHSNPNPYTHNYVITHELGHSFDYYNNILFNYKSSILGLIPKFPFGFGKFVTVYASTKSTEDFAESFAYYFTDPQSLKNASQIKYFTIKQLVNNSIFDKVWDNKVIRELIKKASLLIPAPVRVFLDILSFKSTTNSLKNSVDNILKANEKGDKKEFVFSKLNLWNSLLLLNKSLFSIFSIPINYVLKKLIEREMISEELGNKLANLFLSYTAGPVLTTLSYAINSKNSKKWNLLIGLSNILVFNALKLSFPYLIPILVPLEKLSTFALMELLNKFLK